MKGIDNLRDYVLTAPSICSTTRAILVGYIDNIEREVAAMVPLPVDADGVPIHVGDVMEWPYGNGEFRVNGIGGNTLFYIDKDSNECEWTAAGDKHHHHAPTVEDVLREFAYGLGVSVADSYVAATAAKLRLTEGEDA